MKWTINRGISVRRQRGEGEGKKKGTGKREYRERGGRQ